MDFETYQKNAMRTCKKHENSNDMLANIGLGLCGEAGEVADLIKKHLAGKKQLDRDSFIKEVGDVLWYIAEGCEYLGISMDEVARANIEKLAKRHPDGFNGFGNRDTE